MIVSPSGQFGVHVAQRGEQRLIQELVSQTPIEALDERILQRFNEAEACEPRMPPVTLQAVEYSGTLPRFRPPLIRDKQSVLNSPHNPINDIK